MAIGVLIAARVKMTAMNEWWEGDERRWLRRHAMAAPFGIFAVTIVLTYVSAPEEWGTVDSLSSAASLVDLGAVIYAGVAVLVERGVKVMFWALDERRKWRDKWRAEAQEEGRVEGRAEGRVEGRVEGSAEALTALLEAGRAEGNHDLEELISRIAKERGIHLNGETEG